MSLITTIYLAGPIEGHSWNDANGWRQRVIDKLMPLATQRDEEDEYGNSLLISGYEPVPVLKVHTDTHLDDSHQWATGTVSVKTESVESIHYELRDTSRFRILNPMRNKVCYACFPDSPIDSEHPCFGIDNLSAKKRKMNICQTDLSDIDESDYILVNIPGTKIPGIGTLAEIGYSFAKHKRIIGFPGDRSSHPFLHHMISYFGDDVNDAIEFILAQP